MRTIGRGFPNMGYGFRFARWLGCDDNESYDSWGNGAAMRVSAVGWIGQSISEVKRLSYMLTSVSHNHIEGKKAPRRQPFLYSWHARIKIKVTLQNI